jgi:hypothetical protein
MLSKRGPDRPVRGRSTWRRRRGRTACAEFGAVFSRRFLVKHGHGTGHASSSEPTPRPSFGLRDAARSRWALAKVSFGAAPPAASTAQMGRYAAQDDDVGL